MAEVFEQFRQVGRVVLQIGVKRRDEPASSGVDAGEHRGGLAHRAASVQDSQPEVLPSQFGQAFERGVVRAVIDDDQFSVDPATAIGFDHRPFDLLDQWADVFLLVERRDDDGQERAMWGLGVGHDGASRQMRMSRPSSGGVGASPVTGGDTSAGPTT